MKRSMFQCYVKKSNEAVPFYQKAFGAEIVSSYPHPDGTYYHCELDVYGQIFAVSEAAEESTTGNTMQFCLHFGEGSEEALQRAYAVLKEGATFNYPLRPCDFSTLMTDLIDRYGVRWCLFI